MSLSNKNHSKSVCICSQVLFDDWLPINTAAANREVIEQFRIDLNSYFHFYLSSAVLYFVFSDIFTFLVLSELQQSF